MNVKEARNRRKLWRFVVKFSSIAAFAVSALAMLFTGLQWKEARRTADDAEKAMFIGQRSYVGLDSVQYRGSDLLTELDFDVRAYGSTPARVVQTLGSCEVTDKQGVVKGPPSISVELFGKIKAVSTFGRIDMPPVSAIMPGSQSHGHCTLAVLRPGDRLSVEGYIAYDDVFDSSHVTHFCYSGTTPPPRNETLKMELCSEGNDAN